MPSGLPSEDLVNVNGTNERRKRPRHPLRCRVRFFRRLSDSVAEGVTENLSSVGFYCLLLTPLKLGESLKCHLKMPSHDTAKDESLLLECHVRVVRIDEANEGGSCGIRFQIESYGACPIERFAAKALGA